MNLLRQTSWDALAAFAPVCGHEFTGWDDRWTIETNPWLNPPSLHGLRLACTRPDKGLYIPVTYTIWSALSAVSQVNDPATNTTTGGLATPLGRR